MAEKHPKLTDSDLILKSEDLVKKLLKGGYFADFDAAFHFVVTEKLARAEVLKANAAQDKKLAAKLSKQARHAQKSIEQAKARTDDRDRKIIAGAIVLKAVEGDTELKKWFAALLDRNISKNDRRALFFEQFGIEPFPDEMPQAAQTLPEADIVQEPLSTPAQDGPVKYPVLIFQVGENYGGWSPDFLSLKIEGRTKQDALGNAIEAIHAAVNNATGTASKPSTEKDARQAFKSSAAQRFGTVPDFTLEWVAVE